MQSQHRQKERQAVDVAYAIPRMSNEQLRDVVEKLRVILPVASNWKAALGLVWGNLTDIERRHFPALLKPVLDRYPRETSEVYSLRSIHEVARRLAAILVALDECAQANATVKTKTKRKSRK